MVDTELADLLNQMNGDNSEQLLEWGRQWWWMAFELPRLCRQLGDTVRGFSFCQKEKGWLLCLRVVREGQPQVVYINKPDALDCVQTLKRKFLEGTLVFWPDRYA